MTQKSKKQIRFKPIIWHRFHMSNKVWWLVTEMSWVWGQLAKATSAQIWLFTTNTLSNLVQIHFTIWEKYSLITRHRYQLRPACQSHLSSDLLILKKYILQFSTNIFYNLREIQFDNSSQRSVKASLPKPLELSSDYSKQQTWTLRKSFNNIHSFNSFRPFQSPLTIFSWIAICKYGICAFFDVLSPFTLTESMFTMWIHTKIAWEWKLWNTIEFLCICCFVLFTLTESMSKMWIDDLLEIKICETLFCFFDCCFVTLKTLTDGMVEWSKELDLLVGVVS